MIRKAELLNAKTILKRMETQREMMGMTRQDISYLTDIPYSTLTNNFQKNKVPMFDDLYRMSLSIGMPMDELVSEEEPAYSLNKDNMLYWKEFTPSRSFSETFIQAFPDKVALARTFNAMAQKSGYFLRKSHRFVFWLLQSYQKFATFAMRCPCLRIISPLFRCLFYIIGRTCRNSSKYDFFG